MQLMYHPEFIDLAKSHRTSFELAYRTNNGAEPKCQLHLSQATQPFTQRYLKTLPEHTPTLLLDDKGLWLSLNDGKKASKVQPSWLAMQRRVVSAGKKNELLLKAAKITPDMHIIDATAGFGHDAILMAGRGAKVTMLESSPMMHLLLTDAIRQISLEKNWRKLHARLSLHCTDATNYLVKFNKANAPADLVYLDPMFPDDSYGSAQVNKNMQMLHIIAKPPTLDEEARLLAASLSAAKRVVVKRPMGAPFLANKAPKNQWLGDVVRFDGYTVTP